MFTQSSEQLGWISKFFVSMSGNNSWFGSANAMNWCKIPWMIKRSYQ